MQENMAPLQLGYWNIRGLMQPIRFVCEYLEIPYEEKQYDLKRIEGGWDPSEWLADKFNLGLAFPNLPYLIDKDTDIRCTQSDAILRYLCNKHRPELLGKTLKEKAQVDMWLGVMRDIKSQMDRLAYGPAENYQTGLDAFKKNVEKVAPTIAAQIKKPYLIGADLTYADFVSYEILDVVRTMLPGIFDGPDMTPISEFLANFEKIDQIGAYMKSTKFIKRPINNKLAAFL